MSKRAAMAQLGPEADATTEHTRAWKYCAGLLQHIPEPALRKFGEFLKDERARTRSGSSGEPAELDVGRSEDQTHHAATLYFRDEDDASMHEAAVVCGNLDVVDDVRKALIGVAVRLNEAYTAKLRRQASDQPEPVEA